MLQPYTDTPKNEIIQINENIQPGIPGAFQR